MGPADDEKVTVSQSEVRRPTIAERDQLARVELIHEVTSSVIDTVFINTVSIDIVSVRIGVRAEFRSVTSSGAKLETRKFEANVICKMTPLRVLRLTTGMHSRSQYYEKSDKESVRAVIV